MSVAMTIVQRTTNVWDVNGYPCDANVIFSGIKTKRDVVHQKQRTAFKHKHYLTGLLWTLDYDDLMSKYRFGNLIK